MAKRRMPRARGSRRFKKPPLSSSALVDLLRSRGPAITDETQAAQQVSNIGYYRLSAYMVPFQRGRDSHDFKPGATFEDVMSLYSFDRQLRLLVLDALEHIEVRLRAAVTDEMSLKHQDAFWYTEPSYFRDLARHSEFLDQVSERSRRQLEGRPENPGDVHNYRSALEHYLVTYGEPEFPPSWIMMEGLTFGQVKSLYDNLQQREDSNRIARQLGVPGPVLTSWLRTFLRFRNIGAHHGRLWNVVLGVAPTAPKSKSVPWPRSHGKITDPRHGPIRIYPGLAAIQSLLLTTASGLTWSQRLYELVSDYPTVPQQAMGFPADWHHERFWNLKSN